MQKQDKISIIVPCHNEEEVLPLFLKEIEKIYEVMHVKHNVEMEYLFVDDGSTDRTLMFLREQEAENPRVNYLSFSRNFGKEAAMFAGLEKASGDYVVIIDADLQDPPELIIEMYETLQTTDYDCGFAACFPKGRIEDPVVLCENVLQGHSEDLQGQHHGRSQRFPHDDTPDDRCGAVPAGVQPVFQGHFCMGRIQHQVDSI